MKIMLSIFDICQSHDSRKLANFSSHPCPILAETDIWWWPIFWLEMMVTNILAATDCEQYYNERLKSNKNSWQTLLCRFRPKILKYFFGLTGFAHEGTLQISFCWVNISNPSNDTQNLHPKQFSKFKKLCYFDGDGDEARKVYRIVFRVLQIHASSSPYFSTLVKLPFSYKAFLNLMWSKWGGGKSKTDLVLSKNFYLCWRLMFITSKKICL